MHVSLFTPAFLSDLSAPAAAPCSASLLYVAGTHSGIGRFLPSQQFPVLRREYEAAIDQISDFAHAHSAGGA